MAKKFSELVFYPNAKKKGDPEESGGTLDMKNGMPSTVKEEKKSDGMEIKHKSGRTETAKVHITGSDYHIVKTKHGAQYTVDKKGNVLHGHGNTNEGYNDNRTGFAKKKREDDEYHTPDPTTQTHKIGFHVSKDGGEKHHRTVTISNSTKSKEEATATAKAHLQKQGYKIHEEVEIEEGKKPDSLSPGWMLKADPKLKAAVDSNKVKYKEFKKLVGTKPVKEEVEIEESSKEDSLKHAPVAPTIPRKYIRGTPEHKAYKASKAPRTRMPTGKYNEEVELDEGVDPSEVASNPRMYNAETAKKAYYHKSASASDKESLAKHLDRHHGNKNWRKPVKEEAEQIDEVGDTVKGQKLLQKVNKRAVDRVTSKRADTDPAYAKKAQQTHLAANERLKESMTDSWKSVQAMDKGSLTGGKEEAKKHLTYLKAVHTHHKKYGNDTKKVKDKIESINRSRIAEESEQVDEKMNLATAKMGDVIKDFQKSDAPQFAGKSAEKKRQMAIAAKLQADGETKKEETMLNFASFVEALKGNQHKIDKNKNGKVDAHDFKLLRKEETEQIDELSKGTLKSYVAAAQQDNKDHADSRRSGDEDEAKYAKDRMVKRSTGIGAAKNRLNKEEVEHIEEARVNGREYASHGLMHPDHAKMPIHKAGGPHVDFYATKTGDKMQGKVLKNDGKEVHIKAHSDKEMGDGKLHKFKVTANLPTKTNEEVEIEENAFDWKSKKSAPSSGRYEIKRVDGKTIVTRKYNPDTGMSTGTDDNEPAAEKRGRGRPAGSKNRGSAK